MNIKTYMAVAVAALTAACNQTQPEEVLENATVEIREDGKPVRDIADRPGEVAK